jgi:hypothetical protein
MLRRMLAAVTIACLLAPTMLFSGPVRAAGVHATAEARTGQVHQAESKTGLLSGDRSDQDSGVALYILCAGVAISAVAILGLRTTGRSRSRQVNQHPQWRA